MNKTRPEPAWSYSRIKMFDQCPKKYNELVNLKSVKEPESEAMNYGKMVHSAAEHYIRDGLPLEKKFSFMQNLLDSLNNIEGEKHCEFRMGVSKDEEGGYSTCDYFAKDIWLRTVADLLVINGGKAYSVDYKTSKSAKYADTKQLDLVAGSLFVHFPEVKTIKSALAFVVSKDFITVEHTRDKMEDYLSTFRPELWRLGGAMENGVWNAVASPLCGWCPVQECEHWYKPKRR